VERKYKKSRDFGPVQTKDLVAVTMQVRALLDVALNSLTAVDGEVLEKAHAIEDRVDALRKRNNKAAALRMQSGAVVQTEMIFIDMNNHLEAVANHALNVIQAGRRDQAA
jgi:Na+/phosphate symporter